MHIGPQPPRSKEAKSMDVKWTPKLVADRLEEAASTLRRLPSVAPRGQYSFWPDIIHDANDAYGWNDAELRLGLPSAEEITRMDECLEWLYWVTPNELRLVWLRAERAPWKKIMRRFGVCRTTVWSRWTAVLLQIATHLNAGSGKKMFKHRIDTGCNYQRWTTGGLSGSRRGHMVDSSLNNGDKSECR